MSRTWWMSVVCTALSAVTGMGQAVTAPRQLVKSACLVKVSQANLTEIVGHLAGTADVAGKAAKDVFGLDDGVVMGYQVVSTGVVQLTAELPGQSASASAFWRVVGDNLQKAIRQVNEQEVEEIQMQINRAERQKAEALAILRPGPTRSRADQAVQEQLDRMVDLSALKRDTSLEAAIDVVKKSVNPALKVTVVWQDLSDRCSTDPATPIGLDGVNPMKLETGLRLLLKLVSDRGTGGESAVDYAIDGGLVIIAAKQTLKSLLKGAAEGPGPQLSAEELANRRQGLTNQLQEAEMDSLRLQVRRRAIEQQTAELRKRIDMALDQDTLIRELQKLVDTMAQGQARVQALIEQGAAPQAQMDEAVERLVKAKIDLARQRETAAQAAGGEQLSKLLAALSDMSVQAAEKEATLPILHDQLSRLEAQIDQAQTSVPVAIERDLAMKSLRQAGELIQDLTQRLMPMQPPTITVIGAGG